MEIIDALLADYDDVWIYDRMDGWTDMRVITVWNQEPIQGIVMTK